MNHVTAFETSTVSLKCDACGRVHSRKEVKPEGENICSTCERLINLGLETVESISATSKWKRN